MTNIHEVTLSDYPLLGGGGGGTEARFPLLKDAHPSMYPEAVPSRLSSITGTGVQTSWDCRRPRSVAVCQKCGLEFTLRGSSCGDPLCPECWSTWAARAAARGASRTWGFLEATKNKYRPYHMTVSLDPGEVPDYWDLPHKEALKLLRANFREKAKALGVVAGAMVIHVYRIKPECAGYLNDAASRNHTDRWAEVRKLGEKWRDVVYYSPHAHLIAWGYLERVQKGSKDFEYKKIRQLKDEDDTARVVFYLLSHCSPVPRVHNITYLGGCAYNQLVKIHEGTYSEIMTCPSCGGHCAEEGEYLGQVHRDYVLIKRYWAIYQYKGSSHNVRLSDPGNWAV